MENNKIEEGSMSELGMAHYVTEQDIAENEGVEWEIGDLIYIPMTEEQKAEWDLAKQEKLPEGTVLDGQPIPPADVTVETAVEDKEIKENYRECTCGRLVALPDGSGEEFTMCECGIKHTR